MRCLFCLIIAALTGTLLALPAAPAEAARPGLAREVLAEINLARTDPLSYAGFIREFRSLYRGKSYRLPGKREFVITSEGVSAVDEAIRVLSRQKPVPALAWSSGLAAAAAELVHEEGITGTIGHQGIRCGGPQERINRHGIWRGGIAENIGYGPDEARLVVMQLIVDDGVPNRGHRNTFYRGSLRLAGVDCGSHPAYRTMCVIDFADWFREHR